MAAFVFSDIFKQNNNSFKTGSVNLQKQYGKKQPWNVFKEFPSKMLECHFFFLWNILSHKREIASKHFDKTSVTIYTNLQMVISKNAKF